MQKLLTWLQLVPAIIAAVKAFEQLIPEPGKGAVKLAAMREIMELADSGVTAIWPIIEKIVSVVVNAMNTANPKLPQAE